MKNFLAVVLSLMLFCVLLTGALAEGLEYEIEPVIPEETMEQMVSEADEFIIGVSEPPMSAEPIDSVDENADSGEKAALASPADFEIENGVLVRYNGEGGDVVIPNGVTCIDEFAFEDCDSLTTVTIPDGVTSIGYHAFHYCENLKGINIPNTVLTIDNGAFSGTGITSIVIPGSVKAMGAYTFYNCESLTDVTILKGVTDIGANAFEDCFNLTSMAIPEGVKSIGRDAFQNCLSLTELKLPNTLQTIGDDAFRSCDGLKSVSIPNGVTKIGDEAFQCCYSLETVSIPDSVVSIGAYAFQECPSLVNVKLSANMDVIETNLFNSCESLKEVSIPSGVTKIGDGAFGFCDKLESVFIPETVKSIGENVFHAYSVELRKTIPLPVTISTVCGSYAQEWAGENGFKVEVSGHTPVTDAAVAPTCTTDGLTEGSHCAVCGAVLVAQQAIPATGHTPVADYGYAPTCTVDGLTEGSHCAVCGAVLVAQQVIPATGHSPVADYGYAPSCTVDGLTEGSHCGVCGAVLVAQQVIPATGHTPVYVPAQAPAYQVPGYTEGSYCAVCGTVLQECLPIPALTYQEVALPNVKSNGAITVSLGEQRLLVPSFAAASGWTVSGYTSSKPAVASVDGNGLVTANAEGKAKITVSTNEKKKATLTIQVVDPYKPASVAIAQGKAITITMGQPLQLNAGLAPETARATLTWTSNKPAVASVDGNGLVIPQGEGKAKITVTTHNKKKATITVQVVDPYKPASIAIAQGKAITITMGQPLQLNAVLAPETAQATMSWTSNKPKVATVDGNGLVTPVGEGKAKITVVTQNKKKATITVQVVDPNKPLGIAIAQGKAITMKAGESLQLYAGMTPDTAQSALTWTSNKPAIASVDGNGVVTALKKGKTKVTVMTYNKKKATITVNVVE